MLAFERRVTTALLSHPDDHVRARAERFVESSLRAMPDHLRLGVLAESVAVWALVSARRWTTGASADDATAAILERLSRSRVGLLRQYPRLFRSLALFAECEAATP